MGPCFIADGGGGGLNPISVMIYTQEMFLKSHGKFFFFYNKTI